jgi:hypothetical protein
MRKTNSNFVFNSISTNVKVEIKNVKLDGENVKIGRGGGAA